ncbi:MAG: type II secretion system GspH family protein, partial [Candidatus Fibromonas sp.]|nr:type II secretion system GspH family protein [Candidatus Fibromonas sp.]
MKKAFTLIELLVYMIILGFIIVVAGRVFSDSTGMRIRTQNMTKATEEVNKVAELIKEDMSQMGVKAWGEKVSSGETVFDKMEKAYWDLPAEDLSSFSLGNDNILFKKISYDENNGKYIGTRLISWALTADGILRRRCVTIDPTSTPSTPSPASNDPEIGLCPSGSASSIENADGVIMATNVRTFKLVPSLNNSSSLHFGGPPDASGNATFGLLSRHGAGSNDYKETIISQPINIATLSGFERNDDPNGQKRNQVFVTDKNPTSGTNYTSCKKFTFEKGETYAVKFKTPINIGTNSPDSLMTLFQPSLDHIAVGLRKSDDGKMIDELKTDFMFYPPQENDAGSINQYFEFSVPEKVSNACVAFTFAFYSGTDEVGPHKGVL